MPTKRKIKDAAQESADAPEVDTKKETKGEKLQRIEKGRAKAKAWAEQRKALLAAKKAEEKAGAEDGEETTTAASPAPSTRKTPKRTPAKKATTRRSTAASTSRRSTRKKAEEEEEDASNSTDQPKPKRRRIAKEEETAPPANPPVVLTAPVPSPSPEPEPESQPAPSNAPGTGSTAPTPAPVTANPAPSAPAQLIMSHHGAVNGASNIVYVPVPVNIGSAPPAPPQPPSSHGANGTSEPIAVPSQPKPVPVVPPSPVQKVVHEPKPEPMAASIPVPVVEEEEEEEEPVDETEQETQRSLSSSKKPSFIKRMIRKLFNLISITAVFFGVFAAFTSMDMTKISFPKLAHDGKTTSDGPPCFLNHGFGGDNEEVSEVSCENPTACPEFGRCEGGELIDCNIGNIQIPWEHDGEGFYTVSTKKDQCVVSPSAMEDMLTLHSSMVDLTLQYVCRSNVAFLGTQCSVPEDEIFVDGNGSIGFAKSQVANYTDMTEVQVQTLLKLMDTNDIQMLQVTAVGEDGVEVEKEYISMSEEYMRQSLPLPSPCYLRLWLWDALRVFSAFAYGCLKVFCEIFWDFATANPLPTLGLMFFTYTILWFRSKRNKIFAMRKEATEVLEIAFDKLVMDCNEGEGYAGLHLRDEIAHTHYTDPKARKRLNNLIWPKVLILIRADNRVAKSRKTIGGKSLEWFEWASDSSRKKRRSLAAANAADKTKVES